MSFAFVFPGQGSQSVGMLAELGAQFPTIRRTFDEASAALDYDLWELTQSGPADLLNATERTQPAMLAAGVAVYRLWRERGGDEPADVAGHSLGEFAALVCAGTLEFGAAVGLVAYRGRVMQEAVPPGTGAMAAVLGLDEAQVREACSEAAQGEVVEAVNLNAPAQIVIAGAAAAVDRAAERCKARGAKRVVPLPVSVPSHSSLMEAAAHRLQDKLSAVEIKAPAFRYVSAVDAAAHSDPEDIRSLLGRQLARPVRWWDTVAALSATRVSQLIECGPGRVLTGLNRRIEKRAGLQFLAIDDIASLEAALSATKGIPHAAG